MKDTRTDDQLNRIIARWMWWDFIPSHDAYSSTFNVNIAVPDQWRHNELHETLDEVPGYCSDLNLMHDAEDRLFPEKVSDLSGPDRWFEYRSMLESKCVGRAGGCIRASARERAEALVAVVEHLEKTA